MGDMHKVINKDTLLPISFVILLIAIAVEFISVRTIAEANSQAIKANEARTVKAIDFTNESRRRIFDRLTQLEKAISRMEGKLDMMLKDSKKD